MLSSGRKSPLKRERCQVAMLQETHLSDIGHVKLRRNWVGQVFYSSFNSKSRGVAILFHRSLPFTLEKVVKDSEGRYVLLSGCLYGEQVVLGCIYAPNVYEPSFLPQLISDLTSFSSQYIVLGGDFNCVLDSTVDMSPPRVTRLKKSEKMLEFLSDLNLYDVWRVMHPTDEDYSFFSIPHQFVLDGIENCTIGTKLISDHAPVSIVISPALLGPCLQQFINYITREWEGFIAINKTPGMSPSTLWEAGKAYLRGAIISYTSAQKKKELKIQLDLEQTVAELEVQFRQHPTGSVAKQLEAARSALNQLLTKKAQTHIFYAKHRLFEFGNKPGRLLARLAKNKIGVNTIPALTDSNGKRQSKSADINKIMKLFYQDLLYTSQCKSSTCSRKGGMSRGSTGSSKGASLGAQL
uniref:Endonuclease/exonuclease/phosphatase domain-containing protein n=1 Tax=Oryzias melastigma TaxID=30732 RepID=A0A3B3BIE4_ORYME